MNAHPAPYEDLLLDPTRSTDGVRIALGMVASVDGAVAIDGRSGGLGGPADRAALPALRDAADVVMVGAATLRAEGYRTIGGSPARRERRLSKRLAALPRLAVVTASGSLPPDHPLLEDREHRALVITHAAALAQVVDGLGRSGYTDSVETIVAGATRLDAGLLRRALRDRGLTRIVCEGGPTLAGTLVEQDAVDEVFLTVAPRLVGGHGATMLHGVSARLRELRLRSCTVVGDEVLLRYEREAANEQG